MVPGPDNRGPVFRVPTPEFRLQLRWTQSMTFTQTLHPIPVTKCTKITLASRKGRRCLLVCFSLNYYYLGQPLKPF